MLPFNSPRAAVSNIFMEDNMENVVLYKHFFLLLKLSVYHFRKKKFLSVTSLANWEV